MLKCVQFRNHLESKWKTDYALATPEGLRMPIGDGDHLLPSGPHTRARRPPRPPRILLDTRVSGTNLFAYVTTELIAFEPEKLA
ncbi:hypothetical protein EVAR_41757_1 [Eumeta japonica]|uniref:Uncharacterized protein n=1 Tax=Eumeta variegata TaxID=151549 RepID=A0A4C1VYK7_EUMVA|nr:hypothetical protein EVAR_41757_1 [Eumeta japonica]